MKYEVPSRLLPLSLVAPFPLPAQQAAGLSYQFRAQHKVDSQAYWGPIWPYVVHGTAMSKCFLAQAGFCSAADSLLSEAGSSSVDLSSSCSGIAQKSCNQWGHFKSIASPVCFLELALTQVSSLCPTLPLLLPHKPRDDLALCTVQKLFCALLGTLLSCGSCFSKNPNTTDAAALSQSGQKRHDIFHSSWTIYLHFWHFPVCRTSWYKLSDSHCTLQYPYFKNCSANHCNLWTRALNWMQETQFWSVSALLSNCRRDTLEFLAFF